MLYTDMIKREEDKFFFGKLEIGFLLSYCFVNMIIITQATVHYNKKYFILIQNMANYRFNKLFHKSLNQKDN